MKRNIVTLVLVFVALTVAAAVYFTRPSGGPVKASGQIKPTSASLLLDEIKNAKAKVTLVNFWASWCEPCKQEFPFILQVRKELAEKGLNVVLVSLDETRDLSEAQAFLNSQKVDFPVLFKGDNPVSMVGEILPQWQGAIPTSAIFNSDGKLLDFWEGDATLAEFRQRVEKRLEAIK